MAARPDETREKEKEKKERKKIYISGTHALITNENCLNRNCHKLIFKIVTH